LILINDQVPARLPRKEFQDLSKLLRGIYLTGQHRCRPGGHPVVDFAAGIELCSEQARKNNQKLVLYIMPDRKPHMAKKDKKIS